ncbi:MAG: efflux RND transporter periplasmic adaptor subunit [Cellvibrionales bacterium TMED148]|nr:hypothetical protein [Porticoccaceae bacterium]RPG93011.1 MAG: efflux RND transporter periplasmic adaptor subunit [Cellvibrionales bacterium TMED148]
MRIIASLIVLIITACAEESQEKETNSTFRTAKLYIANQLIEPKRHHLHARVENSDTVDLTFVISGEIASIPIFEGQKLKRDAMIAELDARDYELALDYAKSEHALATQELSRLSRLYDMGTLPLSKLDASKTREEMLSIRVEQAEEALKDCKITAPFDGIVLHRFQEAHTSIAPGEPIARFASSNKVELVANVAEDLAAQISSKRITGAFARFSANPQLTWQLSIVEQRGESNLATQTYRTRFALHEIPDWVLRQGMTARITLTLPSSLNRLVVPIGALHTDPEGAFYVWVTSDPDFLVEKRLVKSGVVQRDLVEIKDGLNVGEIVVETGGTMLQEGDRITPLQPPTSKNIQ